MPSRDLTYRVTISTNTAQQQARRVRASIERELRQIRVGRLDTRNIREAVTNARALRQEFDATANAARRAQQNINDIQVPKSQGRTAGTANGALLGGLAGFLTVGLAQSMANLAQEFVRGNTEIKRANVAFVELAGSVATAEGRLIAIQEGAAGAVSQLGAIKIANQAASLGLANTAQEFQRLTEAARVTALISPVINDIESAITELGLASANLSFRRLDQLGLSVTEVRNRMKELQAANAELTDSQAFLEASIDSLIAKGSGIIDSQAAQASGLERLNVAINEFLDQEGAFSNFLEQGFGQLAESVNSFFVLTDFGSNKTYADFLEEEVGRIQTSLTELKQANAGLESEGFARIGEAIREGAVRFGAGEQGGINVAQQELTRQLASYQRLSAAFKQSNQDIIDGVPGALDYRSAIREITSQVYNGVLAHEDIATAIKTAHDEYEQFQDTIAQASAFDRVLTRQPTADFEARQAEDDRIAVILDQQKEIDKALQQRALASVDTAGFENALATLKEQKAITDAAIEELIASGVSDPDELTFRLAEIESQVVGFFNQLDELSKESIALDFTGIDAALGQFDQGFVDFLPGIDDMRDRLVDLQTELQFTSTITAEQAAELEYLEAAAAAVGGESDLLNSVVNSLGTEFLATNESAAALVDAMFQSAAAYGAGQIGAEQHAGTISALGGDLLLLAHRAGIATDSVLRLVSAQLELSGTSGFTVGANQGNAIAQRIQTRNAERERDRQRREAEAAAKRAAREQESAAKRAARSLEKGAEAARRELEGALRGVPGLFGRSQVTQEQLDRAQSGLPQNFADDYLRRLQDEVFNGNDWADVSVDEARTALERVGIAASGDAEILFNQFAEAWENSVLFSDKANLDFINQDAVQLALDMQERAKTGQENIFELFGVAVDKAVEAVGSGITAAGGSGSVETGFTVPVQAQLVPANGDLTAIPTLGGFSPVLDMAAIQGQLDGLTLPGLSASVSPTLAEAALTDIETSIEALEPTVTVYSALDAESLRDTLNQIGTTGVTVKVYSALEQTSFLDTMSAIGSAAPTVKVRTLLDTVSFGDVFEAITATRFSIAGSVSSFGLDVAALDELDTVAAGAAERLKSELAKNISTAQFVDGEIVAPVATGLATAINTQVRGSAESFDNIGRNVSGLILNGVANGWQGTNAEGGSPTSIAQGLVTEASNQFTQMQGLFYVIGQSPAQSIMSGFQAALTATNADGTTKSQMVDGMLSSITTGIRANSENFRQRGGTIALEMMHGFSTQFGNEDFKNTMIYAGELAAGYLKIGIRRNLNGVADEIAAKVMDDFASELEAPQ